MYVLVADPEANNYKTYLESKFPALSIHGVSTEEEISLTPKRWTSS